jgi:hypothetical protein
MGRPRRVLSVNSVIARVASSLEESSTILQGPVGMDQTMRVEDTIRNGFGLPATLGHPVGGDEDLGEGDVESGWKKRDGGREAGEGGLESSMEGGRKRWRWVGVGE